MHCSAICKSIMYTGCKASPLESWMPEVQKSDFPDWHEYFPRKPFLWGLGGYNDHISIYGHRTIMAWIFRYCFQPAFCCSMPYFEFSILNFTCFTFCLLYGHGGYLGIRGYQGLVALAATIGGSDVWFGMVGIWLTIVWYDRAWYAMRLTMVYIAIIGHGMAWYGMV